jgi:hypothetical protein
MSANTLNYKDLSVNGLKFDVFGSFGAKLIVYPPPPPCVARSKINNITAYFFHFYQEKRRISAYAETPAFFI